MTGGTRAEAFEALVLAGGAGLRFGGDKLTVPWSDGRLIDGALAAAFAAPVRGVTVVTGADPRVGAVARAFATRTGQAARLRLVHAADHAEGMAATLRAGVASLPVDTVGVFVFLGDMPRIPTAILRAMVDAVQAGAEAAAPLFQGRRGHPVLFGRSLFADLAALTGDEGARTLLGDLGGKVALLETRDDGVLYDVDLIADLDRL